MTDDQIRECLSQDNDRTAMLKAAYRMGMMRAAEICEEKARQSWDDDAPLLFAAEDIRADVGDC